jgi:hypothetical protein
MDLKTIFPTLNFQTITVADREKYGLYYEPEGTKIAITDEAIVVDDLTGWYVAFSTADDTSDDYWVSEYNEDLDLVSTHGI